MNAHVGVVSQVCDLSMAALSRRLRLVTMLEAVDRFCYLGDMLNAGGGCMAAATARCKCAWGKFPKPSFAHVQACAFRPEGSSV